MTKDFLLLEEVNRIFGGGLTACVARQNIKREDLRRSGRLD
jgi:hypothetical protein